MSKDNLEPSEPGGRFVRQKSSIHDRLATRRALFGLLQTQPNVAFTELTGVCGFDFLILDGEHGVFSESEYVHAMQVLAAVDSLALVRLPNHDLSAVGRYLDIGAQGIVVPNVSTPDQAKALVRAMDYPPSGTRGFGAAVHRATRYGLDNAMHRENPRGAAGLILMIESPTGVENIDRIAEIDGVDGIFIGPSDLSANLGCLSDFARPAYAQAVSHIEGAVLATGKILGTAPHPGYSVDVLVARGYRLLLLDADMSLIREAMLSRLSHVREQCD